MAKKATVIGAGIGGLASAALLAKDGWNVTVLEKNSQVGGRARIWEEKGFRFDMGPSWYLMPEVFERFFESFGKKREDFYKLHKLDPSYKVYFSPNDALEMSSDLEKTLKVFESFEEGGAERLRKYLNQARYKYEVAMREFLYRNYSTIFDFFNRRLMTEGLRLNIFSRLDRFVRAYFTDRRARQLLEYAMVFLGTSPVAAPALYSIMAHVDMNLGVFYPEGGLAGVGQAIARLAESVGVEIRLDHEVKRIDTEGGKAKRVFTEHGLFESDIVVVNADYAHSETQLLAPRYQSFPSSYWSRKVFAPSMFILYIGLKRKLKDLEHHNLYFASDWEKHFDKIFKNPDWPEKPCFYISCIAKTDKAAAPPGGENVFVLVPVAPGLDDNDSQRESYADHVISHVEEITGENLHEDVALKRIYSHRDFSADYNAYRGTALGLSHTLLQTAVFRPSIKSRRAQNLYYVGQYTHPGVGVPMVIISAQVAANLINGEHR